MNGCSTKAGQESLVSHDAFGVLIFLGVTVTLEKNYGFVKEERRSLTSPAPDLVLSLKLFFWSNLAKSLFAFWKSPNEIGLRLKRKIGREAKGNC